MFPLAVVVTLALALSPAGFFGLTGVMAEVFEVAMTPFTFVGNMAGQAMRAAPPSPNGQVDVEGDRVAHFQNEMVEFERLYRAEREKVLTLQRQVNDLQRIPNDMLDGRQVTKLLARVGMRAALDPLGPVTLHRGSRHGVSAGTIAVYDAVHLIGQVVEVSPFQSTLLPLANSKTPLIDARIFARDRTKTTEGSGIIIQLQARGDGTFAGPADRLHVIHPGDEVVLMSPAWPASAQAMHVGIVHSVTPDDMQPLRNIVIVKPAYQISQVAEVVLKIESDTMTETASAESDKGNAG
jgi:cell shape-determining protein MreC